MAVICDGSCSMTEGWPQLPVDRLADRVAALHRVTKTEAVRRALIHELEREGDASSLVERGMAFARAIRERSNPTGGLPATKTFIDGLYGDD